MTSTYSHDKMSLHLKGKNTVYGKSFLLPSLLFPCFFIIAFQWKIRNKFSKFFSNQEAFVMNRYGIQFQVKNSPSLDPEFMPILKFNRAFLQSAKKPVSFAVERSNGQVAVCNTFIHGTPRGAWGWPLLCRPAGQVHAVAPGRLQGLYQRRWGRV